MDHADTATSRLPGAILASERERQGLAPADIAQRLHMSVWQVEALEAGEYERLPRGTFLRGFVRNYAKVVSIPADDLLARLADHAPRQAAPRIVVPSQNIRFDPIADRMSNPYVKAAGLSALVIVLGFAAMYWWVFVRTAPQAAVARKTVEAAPAMTVAATKPPVTAPAPPPISPPAVVPPEPAPLAAARVEPPKTEAPKAEAPKKEAPKPEPPKPEPPKPDAPAVRTVASTETGGVIKLRFKGKSWVEVRDARGKTLLTGLNDAGSETEVSGRPPFKVVVGNAQDVRLFFNDREVNLEPHMREAVARITVE